MANLNPPDKIIVICIDFSDMTAAVSIDNIRSRFTSPSGNSLSGYFNEVSYGNLNLSIEVHGWYRAPETYAYYVNNNSGLGTYPQNSSRLVLDAISIAAADTNINWNGIDTNSDSVLDFVFVVHAGAEAANSGANTDFWATTWTWASARSIGTTGKTFIKGVISAEYISSPTGSLASGVDCHETGHLLGWPDLYDTTGASEGVGNWSLMGSGNWLNNAISPCHPDPWCKSQLNWLTIDTNLTGNIGFVNIEDSAYCLKYTSPNTGEYWLVENRKQLFYDEYLPGNGVLIWHVNENMLNNRDKTCYKVGVVQADGQYHLENHTNRGDSNDPYPTPTNNSFTPTSTPRTQLCNGTVQEISFTDIHASTQVLYGMEMTVTIQAICAQVGVVLQI